jgi:dienelactone hydrolase
MLSIRLSIACAASALCMALLPPTVLAQTAPTLEELVRPAEYVGALPSRNGRFLATTIVVNGRRNLAIVELESMTRVTLTDYSDFDVIDIDWVGNDRLLYKLGRAESPDGSGEFGGGGLFMVSRDGKERLRLTETRQDARRRGEKNYRSLSYVRSLPGTDVEVLAIGNLRDPETYDLYQLNILTGATRLLTETRPQRTLSYVLDGNRVPRVAKVVLRDSNTVVLHYRVDERSPWQEIHRYERTAPGIIEPLYFEANNKTMVVASNIGRANMAVFRYDPAQRKLLDLFFGHPKLDMGADAGGGRDAAGHVSIDSATEEVTGYTLLGERTQTTWNTEAGRRIPRIIDKALPDTYNVTSRLRGNLFLITASSDRWPTTWHLWDESKGTIEDLAASRAWLLPDKLLPMRPFTLKTRDGLEIPSYYFLPRGYKPGDKLPTVVHIHGGPFVRPDIWGRYSTGVREAQALASRGYAVVLPNFRITPGFGNDVYYRGFGALGREMIDDHEDAARWAVQQGFADPSRICISGASYGGYAALMALARHPATFKCAVSGLPLTDLDLFLTSPAGDIAGSYEAVPFWRAVIGIKPGQPIPRELSPVNLADRIKQPVMLYAGADDVRTPLEQTTRMVEALTRAGNAPKVVMVKQGEGHGFGRPENVRELYETMLKFLDESIGPGRR